METFKHNGVSFTTWDVSGRSGIVSLISLMRSACSQRSCMLVGENNF